MCAFSACIGYMYFPAGVPKECNGLPILPLFIYIILTNMSHTFPIILSISSDPLVLKLVRFDNNKLQVHHTPLATINFYKLSFWDGIQRRAIRLIGDSSLSSSLDSLAHRRTFSVLQILPWWLCSDKKISLIPRKVSFFNYYRQSLFNK